MRKIIARQEHIKLEKDRLERLEQEKLEQEKVRHKILLEPESICSICQENVSIKNYKIWKNLNI